MYSARNSKMISTVQVWN